MPEKINTIGMKTIGVFLLAGYPDFFTNLADFEKNLLLKRVTR